MPQVGLKPTIPVFELAKTVHALDRAAIVTGGNMAYYPQIQYSKVTFRTECVQCR
jgi:hypothetical protein